MALRRDPVYTGKSNMAKRINKMPNDKEYSIKLYWDEESSTWVATSDDIPGLVLGSGSVDLLMERVRFAAPEVMELNGIDRENCTLHFHFDRYTTVCL